MERAKADDIALAIIETLKYRGCVDDSDEDDNDQEIETTVIELTNVVVEVLISDGG